MSEWAECCGCCAICLVIATIFDSPHCGCLGLGRNSRKAEQDRYVQQLAQEGEMFKHPETSLVQGVSSPPQRQEPMVVGQNQNNADTRRSNQRNTQRDVAKENPTGHGRHTSSSQGHYTVQESTHYPPHARNESAVSSDAKNQREDRRSQYPKEPQMQASESTPATGSMAGHRPSHSNGNLPQQAGSAQISEGSNQGGM